MNIKKYKELIRIYDSWWDSMPHKMQEEIREFYNKLDSNNNKETKNV